jgi:hypothetical protein
VNSDQKRKNTEYRRQQGIIGKPMIKDKAQMTKFKGQMIRKIQSRKHEGTPVE